MNEKKSVPDMYWVLVTGLVNLTNPDNRMDLKNPEDIEDEILNAVHVLRENNKGVI